MALGRINILIIVIFLMHEHGILFSIVSSISLSVLYSFLSIGLSCPWLNLFLNSLFFLMELKMGLFS